MKNNEKNLSNCKQKYKNSNISQIYINHNF